MATASVTVHVQGPGEESDPNHRQKLASQLPLIPRDSDTLIIQDDTPSDIEWAILGHHFSRVRDLEIHTGFHEDLNDKHIPLHWPLSRLLISSACGVLTRTPFIRQGRISHLILDYTSGLRFEGPDNDELVRRHKDASARGEAKTEYITCHEGTPEEKKIELIVIPELAQNWLNAKYGGEGCNELDPENLPPTEHAVNLKTLEVIENAMETVACMALALPHVVFNASTLHISSTYPGCDFQKLHESNFLQLLRQMDNLETLQLSVGEVFQEESHLLGLYKELPRSLTTLRLRGPAMLTQREEWKEWEGAFASQTFFPKLEKLSIEMDLYYVDRDDGWRRKEKAELPEELRIAANAACERLCAIARSRGVIVETMQDWKRVCE
ncbi:uncharacterized protein BP01DRAFT_355414 [Aspergillus saccharolyticus JOP 1030-1]|uniref:Uncharacterized protein n=1 Tax=Aspergillus saccharolyticus JOP 1030-1 TaxID=1450539 RepID=A0A318ZJJ9_9EURO|nr:hypothetical protein BP01DRAFT_355414 [Aspergillus saccharolyticus JOP 1030-1]PYH47017.1 hypothetical protein BP01DRAFT_355414 [Aspergillus saccharolyticus JOP 1030-1]